MPGCKGNQPCRDPCQGAQRPAQMQQPQRQQKLQPGHLREQQVSRPVQRACHPWHACRGNTRDARVAGSVLKPHHEGAAACWLLLRRRQEAKMQKQTKQTEEKVFVKEINHLRICIFHISWFSSPWFDRKISKCLFLMKFFEPWKTFFCAFNQSRLNFDRLFIDLFIISIYFYYHDGESNVLTENLTSNLTWKEQIASVEKKVTQGCHALFKLQPISNIKMLRKVYFSLIYPDLQYAILTWGRVPATYFTHLKVLHNRSMRCICKISRAAHVPMLDLYHSCKNFRLIKYMNTN